MQLLRKPKHTAIARGAIIAVLSLFGVVTAFGIAPDTVTNTVPTRPVVISLNLADFNAQDVEDPILTYQDRVQRGDTVAGLLARLNVDDKEALQFMKRDPVGREIFQLKPGRTVQADITGTGKLLRLRYLNRQDSLLVVEGETLSSSLRTKRLLKGRG